MERTEKINKLYNIHKYLSYAILTIHFFQFTLINSLFFTMSWLVILSLYIIRMIISNKIDKLRTEDLDELFEKMLMLNDEKSAK